MTDLVFPIKIDITAAISIPLPKLLKTVWNLETHPFFCGPRIIQFILISACLHWKHKRSFVVKIIIFYPKQI